MMRRRPSSRACGARTRILPCIGWPGCSKAGESPRFIAPADLHLRVGGRWQCGPMALVLATAAWQACEFIGLPEAQIILAQAATYVACAPKSNAATWESRRAVQDVREKKDGGRAETFAEPIIKAPPPGRGRGYKYALDYETVSCNRTTACRYGSYFIPRIAGKRRVQAAAGRVWNERNDVG